MSGAFWALAGFMLGFPCGIACTMLTLEKLFWT